MIRFGRTERGYLLTRGKMHDYLQLYIGKQEDLKVRMWRLFLQKI